jgi:hypothetical protein
MAGEAVTIPGAGSPLLGLDEAGAPFEVFAAAARRFRSDHVLSSFSSTYFPLVAFCFITMNSQWLTLRKSSKYSTDQWYLGHVSRASLAWAISQWGLPFHEKDSSHQAVRDQHADTWEVSISKLPPQTLVEAAYPVVCIRSALTVGDAVKEVAVVGPLLPHPLHLGRAWLEVTKVLFSEARLLEHLDLVAGKRRGRGVVARQRAEDALGGLTRPAVWRGEELNCVVGLEQRA